MMNLPDISTQQLACHTSSISWVGMENIALPILLKTDEKTFNIQTIFNVHIDLPNPQVKGIHMSRLYRQCQNLRFLSPHNIHEFLKTLIQEHQDCDSTAAQIEFSFQLPLQQNALKTPNIEGWKYYDISIKAQLIKQQFSIHQEVNIQYSSTCPCSAALSRQLIQEKFLKDFNLQKTIDIHEASAWIKQQASFATPHSQRSIATIQTPVDLTGFQLLFLIQLIESSLKTVTQTAVKRADEQEFAKLNGQNLMFVEDAVRKLNHAVQDHYTTWKIKVNHLESLHSHNAVAYIEQY